MATPPRTPGPGLAGVARRIYPFGLAECRPGPFRAGPCCNICPTRLGRPGRGQGQRGRGKEIGEGPELATATKPKRQDSCSLASRPCFPCGGGVWADVSCVTHPLGVNELASRYGEIRTLPLPLSKADV